MLFEILWACKQKKWCNDDQLGKVGMLFLEDAVTHGGQFNSSNFIANFDFSTEKLAEFRKELQGTKSIPFQFRVSLESFFWAYAT